MFKAKLLTQLQDGSTTGYVLRAKVEAKTLKELQQKANATFYGYGWFSHIVLVYQVLEDDTERLLGRVSK